MSKTSQAAMEILADRLEGLMDRLKQVEQWCAQKPTFAIDLRFTLLEQHIKQLETRLGVSYSSADSAGLLAEPAPEGESAVYKKLHADLIKRGVCSFRFHRVPGPYYDKPIELRAQRLNAPSVDHLCKTMVMENTRAPEELLSIDDPRASKYFMVLVQYTSSIDAGKLGQFVHKVANEVGNLPKAKINMRMVQDEVTAQLTGYGHNAVTPICSATRMPIVMSDKIAALDGHFFLGAGETDLKVAMPAAAFLEGFKDVPVFVANCTP